MKLSHQKFREIQGKLDERGICTDIQRIDKDCLNLVQNFEIVRTAKTRITLKRDVVKLYNEKFGANIGVYKYKKKGRRKKAA